MTKTNAILPEDEVARLRSLRELPDQTRLKSRVLALRHHDWPLRAIGDPLKVTRVGVRTWQLAAQASPEIVKMSEQERDVPTPPLTTRGSGVRPRRVYPKIPAEDAQKMRDLAVLARTVRGSTPKESEAYKAAQEYEKLLDLYVNVRGVPAQHAAREAGVTRRAIVARLEKAGTR